MIDCLINKFFNVYYSCTHAASITPQAQTQTNPKLSNSTILLREFLIQLYSYYNLIIIKAWRMLQKAKEIFRLRTHKNQQHINTLFKQREKACKKTQFKKFNSNLVFNQNQYKSQKDNLTTLEKRKSDLNKILNQQNIDLNALKRCAWNGLESNRSDAWQVLLGHLSSRKENHHIEKMQHLQEYRKLHKQYQIQKCPVKKLIEIDIPRTFFQIQILFNQPVVQNMLKRVLCLWDMTSEGYTQGMGDIAGLLLMILTKYDQDPELLWFNSLKQQQLEIIEADLYWLSRKVCSKFFSYYNITKSKQIQKIMNRIENIIQKSDSFLSLHLKNHGITIFQFAFRWIYVLLSRQIPIRLVFRLMDSYFSSSQDFQILHSYVVASLILRFSVPLLKINRFHTLMSMLQNLPTDQWTKKDIQLLVQEAVVLMHTYSNFNQ